MSFMLLLLIALFRTSYTLPLLALLDGVPVSVPVHSYLEMGRGKGICVMCVWHQTDTGQISVYSIHSFHTFLRLYTPQMKLAIARYTESRVTRPVGAATRWASYTPTLLPKLL